MRIRWVNWDAELWEGDDFWCFIESLDEKRLADIKVARQEEAFRKAHKRRLDNYKSPEEIAAESAG